jgi:hypothetical protein
MNKARQVALCVLLPLGRRTVRSMTIVKATDDAGEASTAAKAQPNKTGKGSRQKRTDD